MIKTDGIDPTLTGIGVAVAGLVLIMLLAFLCRRRRRNSSSTQPLYTTTPTQGYQGGQGQMGYGPGYQPGYSAPQQEGYANYPPAPAETGQHYNPPSGPPPAEGYNNENYTAPTMPPPTYRKGVSQDV